LPARLVQQADGKRRQVEVVGEESQTTIVFSVAEVDTAKRIGVVLMRGGRGQHNGLIGAQAGTGVDGARVAAAKQDAAFCARNEEGAAVVEHMQALEVHVGAIHDIEGAGLRHDEIEHLDIVQFSLGNLNKRGDRAAQVKQGVQLDRSLSGAEARPREHRQAEVDGGGVQGVDRVVEIEAERLAGVHRTRDVDEHLSEVGIDPPVVGLVGIGQRGPRDLAAEAPVIELALNGAKARFDVAETLAEGQLSKSETKKLIDAGKASEFVIAAVPRNAFVELVGREVIHQLGEDDAAAVHASLSESAQGRLDGGQNRGWKFKSKNLGRPPIPMTAVELLTASVTIAGH